MKKSLILAVGTALLLCACANDRQGAVPGPITTGDDCIVSTSSGKILGYNDAGIYTFKGVPYAKAERFMPPQDPEKQSFSNNNNVYNAEQSEKKTSGGQWALRIVLAVLTFPIWLPILIVICALLFTLIVVVCSLIFAAVITAVALIAGGIAAIFETPSIALMLIGVGLIITGIVLLICKPAFNAVIPACGRAVKRFFNWIVGLFKKGEKENV